MCDKFVVVACLFAFAVITDGAIAPFITKCRSDDPKCARQSTQVAIPILAAGAPELGVEVLDPVFFKDVDVSTSDLKFLLNDITIVGLKNCEAKKLQRDVAQSKIFVKMVCTVTLDGHYDVSGRILILPIEGNGKIHVVLKKVHLNIEADMGEKVKNGVKYWDIKGWRHTYELKDNAELHLDNLFGGNEELGRAINALFTTNANDVVNEVGPPIIKTIIARVVKNVNRFFHRVPAEELSID